MNVTRGWVEREDAPGGIARDREAESDLAICAGALRQFQIFDQMFDAGHDAEELAGRGVNLNAVQTFLAGHEPAIR